MMIAPVALPDRIARGAPVSVRMIGTLDRVLVEAFADACAGLFCVGRRTLIVSIRHVVMMHDENLERFAATLRAYRVAGHEILLDGPASLLKSLREAGVEVVKADGSMDRAIRRQIIIAHSSDRRAS